VNPTSVAKQVEPTKLKHDATPFKPKATELKQAVSGEENKRAELNADAPAFIPKKYIEVHS